jgi:citrate lyase subunit beta / citryl-CoA lyase
VRSGDLAGARTLLFVPGDRPDRFATALASEADCVVVDLEDAVAAGAKELARGHVAELLRQPPPKPVVVRINHPATPWGEDDLVALVALAGRPGLCGVMVPKADSTLLLDDVSRRTGLPLLPLVETAAGILAAPALATAPGVVRLVLGHLDLAAELGIDPADELRLAPARFALVVASAAAGLPGPVDGVSTDVRDLERVAAETRSALAAGCTARLCIHPDQVAAVHRSLAPVDDELAWARSVLAAVEEGGVTLLEGRMVDRPVLLRARSVMARATRSVPTPIPSTRKS